MGATSEQLVTVDLEKFLSKKEIIGVDIAQFLFHGLLLKEIDFRKSVEEFPFDQYSGKILALFCSTDAIIAPWAWMLFVSESTESVDIRFGTPEDVSTQLLRENLSAHSWDDYENKRILMKGCSTEKIDASAYLEATKYLKPFAKRINYGEACSFVPIFKPKKQVQL